MCAHFSTVNHIHTNNSYFPNEIWMVYNPCMKNEGIKLRAKNSTQNCKVVFSYSINFNPKKRLRIPSCKFMSLSNWFTIPDSFLYAQYDYAITYIKNVLYKQEYRSKVNETLPFVS